MENSSFYLMSLCLENRCAFMHFKNLEQREEKERKTKCVSNKENRKLMCTRKFVIVCALTKHLPCSRKLILLAMSRINCAGQYSSDTGNALNFIPDKARRYN